MRSSCRRAALLGLLLAIPASALAQAPPPPRARRPAEGGGAPVPAFKISGLMFGDYYDVAQNHRDDLEGQNGFWIRRLYFTYDHTLSKSLSLRVRLEANSKGDFKSSGVNTPYIKDAWLKWAFGAHALIFGMAPTPNIDFIDAFQGYRSVEKSPFDLYRWDSSRDLGLVLQGGLGKDRRTRYGFQFGNGSGTGSETDASKAVRGELAHRFASGLVLEGYADWQDHPDGRDVWTVEAFAGWQEKTWRASLQYGHQERREAGPEGTDLSLDFLSAFAAVQVSPRVTLLGRVDRNFDPIPNGETIDYMPFSDQAKSVVRPRRRGRDAREERPPHPERRDDRLRRGGRRHDARHRRRPAGDALLQLVGVRLAPVVFRSGRGSAVLSLISVEIGSGPADREEPRSGARGRAAAEGGRERPLHGGRAP